MLDIKFIKENPDVVKNAIRDKRLDVNVDKLLTLYADKIQSQQKIESLQQEINQYTKSIKSTSHTKEKMELIRKAKELKNIIAKLEPRYRKTEKEYIQLLYSIPNIPTDDTPVGKDESENKVLKKVGKPTKFTFKPKTHWELGSHLDIIDNERASRISGARFTYLKRELVNLQFALIQFALSVLIDEKKLKKIIKKNNLGVSSRPFIPVIPPMLIRTDVFHKMARLEPKEDKYAVQNDDLYLVGSAEHTLGPLHMNETLAEDKLPLRYVGYSTSFRREAGTYGKDMKGILRLHQFDKLEIESFSLPKNSLEEQNFIIAIQEYLMSELKLSYQVVAICTGDMAVPDAQQIDIEAWLPGQNKYRETHTADLMTDYQSRRLKTFFRGKSGKKALVHMNDATVFAIGRTIIAIMENYQRKDGSILIPKVLEKYMHGITIIKPR